MSITSRGVYSNLQGTASPIIAEVFTGAAVGDLSVVTIACNTGQIVDDIRWSANGTSLVSSAGYTEHLDIDNGTRRTVIWSKILTADDFLSENPANQLKYIGFNNWQTTEAANAITWQVLGADNGWKSNTPEATGSLNGTQGSSPYTLISATDPATAGHLAWTWALNGTGGGNLTVEYDDEGAFQAPSVTGSGGSGATAYSYDGWDETDWANARQGGYKIAARSATIGKVELTNQHGTSKAAAAALWVESPTLLVAGKSPAAASAKTTTPLISPVLAAGKSPAAASAKGALSAPSYLISGKSGAAASAKATLYAPRFVTGKSGAAATAVAATPTVTSVSDVLATGKAGAAASAKATSLFRTWIISGKSGAAASAKGTVAQDLPDVFWSVYITARNQTESTAHNTTAISAANWSG